MMFETLTYDVADRIARITLNRPERLNTIVPPMPQEIEAAVERASLDGEVKVIVLRGAGRAFCAGFDFGGGFHHWDAGITTDGQWDPGKDFIGATAPYGPAIAERFVGTLRRECLDWLVIAHRRHLEPVLRVFVDHYNRHRPHRALNLGAPDPARAAVRVATPAAPAVGRRDRLGGLIHEYSVAA
jgi:hypothetical protein